MCPLRCLGQHFHHHSTSAAVTQQESWGGGGWGDGLSSWPQTFSISLSISWVITGAFDGLFMTPAPLLRDAVRARLREDGAAVPTFDTNSHLT